ncbi:MAG: PAS domain S-box protein [Thermodesulfobacteriota bacterium]
METGPKSQNDLLKEIESLQSRVAELEAMVTRFREIETSSRNTEKKARDLLNNIEDGYYEVDLRGNFIFCNEAYAEILGLSPEEILGGSYKHIGGHDTQQTFQVFNNVFRTGIPTKDMERKYFRPDGSHRDLETSVSLSRDENGRPVGFCGIVRDITERKKTEIELAEWKQRYELIVASSGQVVNEYDLSKGSLLWGGSLEKVLGYLPREMTGRAGQWIKLLHPDDRARVLHHYEIAQREKVPVDIEYRFLHKKGNYIWLHDRGFYVYDDRGNPFRFLSLMQDITDRKNFEAELRNLSLRDQLTGLYNRRGFQTLAEQELKTANRMKRGVFLLFVDLDDLKGINDTYGHPEGDRALIAVVNILKETFREPDIIARLGGDEFVVLAIEGTSESSAENLRLRLDRNLSHYQTGKKRDYTLSLSIGVGRFNPQQPVSVEELIAQADKSMYEEKNRKRS